MSVSRPGDPVGALFDLAVSTADESADATSARSAMIIGVKALIEDYTMTLLSDTPDSQRFSILAEMLTGVSWADLVRST